MKIHGELSSKIANMSFLCAIFVVLIHCEAYGPSDKKSISWYLYQLLFIGISSIAVPYFFLISGFFLGQHRIEKDEYVAELKKRQKTIAFPFYFWGTAFWLYEIALLVVTNQSPSLCNIQFDSVINIRSVIQLTGFGPSVILGPLWYLRTLVLLVIISPLVVRLNKRPTWLVCPVCCIATYILIEPEDVSTPLKRLCRFLFSPTGLLFFSIGLYLARTNIKRQFTKVHYLTAFAIGMLLLLVRTYVITPGYALAIREFAIPFLMFGIWGMIPRQPLPPYLQGLSFSIYVLHMFVLRAVDAITSKTACLYSVENWMHLLVRAGMIVILTIALSVTSKKLFPNLMRFLTGGR